MRLKDFSRARSFTSIVVRAESTSNLSMHGAEKVLFPRLGRRLALFVSFYDFGLIECKY